VLLNCPQLIVVDVRNCENLDDSLFANLDEFEGPLPLEHLDICGCYNISKELALKETKRLMPAVRQFTL